MATAETAAVAKSNAPRALFEDDDESKSSSSSPSSDSEERKTKSRRNKAPKLKINRKYARDFEARNQREELKRAKFEPGGDDPDGDGGDGSGSSSSSEDEDAELWTKRTDVDILRTINAIRSGDARIYDPRERFFRGGSDEDGGSSDDSASSRGDDDGADAEEEPDDRRSSRKAKPKRYKDVVREQVLETIKNDERGGAKDDGGGSDPADSSSGEEKIAGGRRSSHSRLAYNQQQQELRRAFLDSTKDDPRVRRVRGGDDDGEAGDEWLTLKKSSKPSRSGAGHAGPSDAEYYAEMRKLEASLRNSENNGSADPTDRLVDPRGEVQDGERFLLEYFKNRTWVENEEEQDDSSASSGDDGPADSMRSATARARPRDRSDSDEDDEDDDASLNELDKADDFEAQYNFRFEQAAAGGTGLSGAPPSGADHSLLRYGRGQDMHTLRRKDESRKDKRLARQERKAAERQAKEEQLRRLKNAKRQEVQRKLQQVKAVLGEVRQQDEKGGADEGAVDEATILKLLEGDFDPQKFEELMKETYGDDFYSRSDAEWRSDKDVRNALRHDEDGELLVGQDTEDGGLYDNVEDEGDDGVDDAADDEHQEDGDWMEDEYADREFQEAEDETELEKKVKSKLMDELYKLDYEDIVAGQPTRFKYRQVEPNNFGLSAEEILFARDSTLKQFVSLKKIAPYREEEHFVGSKKRRRFREMLKHDLEEEIASTRAASASTPETAAAMQTNQSGDHASEEQQTEGKKHKKNRRLKKKKKADKEPKAEVVTSGGNNSDGGPKKDTSNPGSHPNCDEGAKAVESQTSGDPPLSAERTLKEMNDLKGDAASEKRSKKRKRKSKKHAVEGISGARLASYGL